MNTNRRTATWYSVGTDARDCKTIDEVLVKAKLDYTVEKQQVQLPNGAPIPNRVATVKAGTDEAFGIVSPSYGICQNKEAFDFVNYIGEDITFVKAGQTKSGIIYVIAHLPEEYVLGDSYTPYIIFQNGHNGQIPVKAAIVPLRMVCQNQFNTAFKKSDNTISIRHSSNIENKMEEAKKVLKQTADYMNTFRQQAEELAAMDIKGLESSIVEEFFVVDEDKTLAAQERVIEKQLELKAAYNVEDNKEFVGTAWGMINAYTDVVTHQIPNRQTDTWEDSRFTKVTFDPKVLQKFIKHVKEYV